MKTKKAVKVFDEMLLTKFDGVPKKKEIETLVLGMTDADEKFEKIIIKLGAQVLAKEYREKLLRDLWRSEIAKTYSHMED